MPDFGSQVGPDKYGWGAHQYMGAYGEDQMRGGAGTEYGERMRLAAQKNLPGVQMDAARLQPYLQRSNQSYDQQRQAIDYMKQQAAGLGPSVAKTQSQMGQDQAVRAMLARRGGPMLPTSGGGLYNAANAGAAARAKEMGAAQQGYMQAGGDIRGQTLNERGQNMANAAKYRDIGLTGQEQDEQREMALQKMALMGYGLDQAQNSAEADIALGLQGDEIARQNQMIGMGINAGSGVVSGVGSYFGGDQGGGGQRQPQPGGYVGSSDWGSHQGYY